MLALDDFLQSGIYVIMVLIMGAVTFGTVLYAKRLISPPAKKKGKKKSSTTMTVHDIRSSADLLPVKQQQIEDKVGGKGEKKADKPKEITASDEKQHKQEIKEAVEKSEKPVIVAVVPDAEGQPADDDSHIDTAALPELPSMDTIDTDVDDGPLEDKNTEDLMNLFAVEEKEDSATSVLASTLFDVEVESIHDLGREILDVLKGNRPLE